MIAESRLKVSILVITLLFITSCASAPDNGPSGGVSTGIGATTSDSSNDNAVLGIAALALAGTVLYRTMVNSLVKESSETQSIFEKRLPTFVVEGGASRKWENSDAAYVIFATKADALNKKRHVAFCKSLRDKFYPEPTKLKSRNSTKANVFPTVWPSVNDFFNGKNTCDELVKIYDDNFARNVLHQGSFPTGKGPFLVAFSKDFSGKDKKLYWNLSGYEISDFERQVARWFIITSYHPKQMEKVLLEIASKETTRKIIMSFDTKKDSNPDNFALNIK